MLKDKMLNMKAYDGKADGSNVDGGKPPSALTL